MNSSEEKPIVYCADAIALYEDTGKIVIVERLGSVPGLSLPGGKQDPGESLSMTIVREVREETGLLFTSREVLMTCAEPGRDPRGRYVSTVFVGRAVGHMQGEAGKTNVILLDLSEFESVKDRFVFDHAAILAEYIKSSH